MMRRLILCCIAALCLATLNAEAQKINIGYIYPAGAVQGSETIIAIGGQSISSTKQVIISGEGVSAEIIPPSKAELQKFQKSKKKKISDEDNLQLAQNIKVRIKVAKDAKPGIRDLKVVGGNGASSNRLYFEVGTLEDVVEKEPNNSISEATLIASLPATLNGYVEKSSVLGDMERGSGGSTQERAGKDYFCFEAKSGETIVAQVKARRFVPYLADAVPGWFQAVVSLYDESGKELAYCDDFLLNADPTLIYEVKKNGKYYLKIHDSIYRGREDFVYRINLGVIPYITSIFPLGGEAGRDTQVEIRGVNLQSQQITIASDKDQIARTHLTHADKNGLLSNEFIFETQKGSSERIIKEEEGRGNSRTEAIEIKKTEVVNSKIDFSEDEDWYVANIDKTGMYLFEVVARRAMSPLDAKISLYDSSGKLIKTVDDTPDPSEGYITHQADPEMVQRIGKIGKYYIRIIDTQSKGGEEYAYRLRVAPVEPAFNLSIEPASISIPKGGVGLMSVFVQRKYNFLGAIDLSFEGLPEGFSVSSTKIPAGAKSMRFAVTAADNAEVGKLDLKIKGTAQGDDVSREARPVEEMKQAFYISHLLPTSELRCDITPEQPFTISLKPMKGGQIQLKEGEEVPVRVIVNRNKGFNDAIQIMPKMLSEGLVTFQSITIEEGESEGVIKLETYFWRTPWQPPTQQQTKAKKGKAAKQTNVAKQGAAGATGTADFVIMGTVKASTNNRVAGQARNTINAAVMVNSHPVKLHFPEGKPTLSYPEARRKSRSK